MDKSAKLIIFLYSKFLDKNARIFEYSARIDIIGTASRDGRGYPRFYTSKRFFKRLS